MPMMWHQWTNWWSGSLVSTCWIHSIHSPELEFTLATCQEANALGQDNPDFPGVAAAWHVRYGILQQLHCNCGTCTSASIKSTHAQFEAQRVWWCWDPTAEVDEKERENSTNLVRQAALGSASAATLGPDPKLYNSLSLY